MDMLTNILIGFAIGVAPGVLIYLLGVKDFGSWAWLWRKRK